MKVQFVRDELYENIGRNQGELYLQNSVHDFEPAFAERWLRRGAAKLVKEDEGKEAKEEEVKVVAKGNQSTGGPIKPPVDDQSATTKTVGKAEPATKDQGAKVEPNPLPLKK